MIKHLLTRGDVLATIQAVNHAGAGFLAATTALSGERLEFLSPSNTGGK
jgi:hypothetical protein